ncbi:hypothetical protein DPMN_144736 [Dreissena polymorpha]|uniref:Uncharacterized protein n=1 Tax=Dreissena polymorpha TaxID=45954 RepID=A0A9D4J0J9_DREPO|nr:hypothetical protein DPMN_144736 [Dreissena polymorpha]
MDHNPTWEYFQWTDEKLIKERHPNLLKTWDSYRDNINRADALRYIVLYEFGGVYADLDVNFFRSLDRAMVKYACILPTEPFEQSAFKNKMPYFMNNAIMMCRPKHPFMKQTLANLHLSRAMYTNVDVAGPMFVTSEFLKYANITAGHLYKTLKVTGSLSPYFFKGNIKEEEDDGIYIPNTVYFLNTLNNHFEASHIAYVSICKRFKQMSNIEQRACVDLKRRGFYRKRSPFTFTEHLWDQSYGPLQKLWNPFCVSLKHIERVVPPYKQY